MKFSRLGLPASVTTLVVILLSGCAVVDEFASHEREQAFDSRADAPGSAGSAFDPADFIPLDATRLRMRIVTDGPGEVLRFTTQTRIDALDPALCTPGRLGGTPLLDASWWPAKIPANGTVCAPGWQVFEYQGAIYAWISS